MVVFQRAHSWEYFCCLDASLNNRDLASSFVKVYFNGQLLFWALVPMFSNILFWHILKHWMALKAHSDCLSNSDYPLLFTSEQLGKKWRPGLHPWKAKKSPKLTTKKSLKTQRKRLNLVWPCLKVGLGFRVLLDPWFGHLGVNGCNLQPLLKRPVSL